MALRRPGSVAGFDHTTCAAVLIDALEKNDELYSMELGGRSPYYRQRHRLRAAQRQNRLRGILTSQLKRRNQSLTDETQLLSEGKLNEQSNPEEVQRRIRERNKTKQLGHVRAGSIPRFLFVCLQRTSDDTAIPEVRTFLTNRRMCGDPHIHSGSTRRTLPILPPPPDSLDGVGT